MSTLPRQIYGMPAHSRPQSRARTEVGLQGPAPFFPQPFPGESLYSIIARYQRIRQFDHVALCIDMFGMECRVFSPTLPSSIQRIANRAAGIGLSATDFISNHTAWGFYTAYARNAQANVVFDEMLADDGRAVMTAGQRGAPVGLLDHLRFCPQCLEEMQDLHEEAYWKLIHQIPIVTICTPHNEILRHSTIPGTGVIPGFQVPNAKNCPIDAPHVVPAQANRSLLTKLAKATVRVGQQPRQDPQDWRNHFTDELARRNLLTPAGRMKRTDIQEHINKTLAPIAIAFPELPLDAAAQQTWFGFQMMPARQSSTNRVMMIELAFDMLT